jgi:hypothetical protein
VINPLLGLEHSGHIHLRVALEWNAKESDLDWSDLSFSRATAIHGKAAGCFTAWSITFRSFTIWMTISFLFQMGMIFPAI